MTGTVLVHKIARQREHKSGDFALAFREMVDRVLVGSSCGGAANHVLVERTLGVRAAALRDLVFGTFDLDAVESSVLK